MLEIIQIKNEDLKAKLAIYDKYDSKIDDKLI